MLESEAIQVFGVDVDSEVGDDEVKKKTKKLDRRVRMSTEVDAKTGKTILPTDRVIKIHITSEEPIRILKTSEVIDKTFYLTEKNAKKLFGTSTSWLRYA